MSKKEEFMDSYIEGWSEFSDDLKREIWSSLSDRVQKMAIKEDLLEDGVGKYNFMFTEIGRDEDASTKFKNIYEYDHANWEFQKECMLEAGGAENNDQYELELGGDWVRLIVKDEVVMGCIDSLGTYVYGKIANHIDKISELFLPRDLEMISGERDERGLTPCDIKSDTFGRDDEYELFSKKQREYTSNLYKEYKSKLPVMFPSTTYIKKSIDYDGGEFWTFIMSDIETAKKVTVENFYGDIKFYRGDFDLVKDFIKREKKRISREITTWFVFKG